jgi:hypothetical protein
MDFALLQERLVALIRERVRSGEVTERGLATLAGVSQPHVHNVLKGARRLSTDMADHLLRRLRIDLLDLIEEETRLFRMSQAHAYRAVPCLGEPLGPGRPFPAEGGDYYPLRPDLVDDLQRPLVARVGTDEELPLPLNEHDLILLDCGESVRLEPQPGLYVVQIRGEALIRAARPSGDGAWEVMSTPRLSVREQAILEVMKAKVVWFSRRLEFPQLG